MTNDQARLFQLLEDFKENIAMAKPSEDLEEEISQLLDRVDPNTPNDQGLSLLRQMVDLDFDNRYNPSYKLAQHMVIKLVHRGANPFGEEGPLKEKRRLIQLFLVDELMEADFLGTPMRSSTGDNPFHLLAQHHSIPANLLESLHPTAPALRAVIDRWNNQLNSDGLLPIQCLWKTPLMLQENAHFSIEEGLSDFTYRIKCMVKMMQNLNEDQLEKHLEKSWSISEKIAKIKHLAGKNWDEWQMLPLAIEWARKGELLILNQATPPVVKKNQLRRV